MATLQITFVSESAGYNNAFGWYNSRTGEAGIIFINTNDDGPKAGISAGTTATLDVAQSDIDAGNIGFFLIPNGASIYGTGAKSALNGPLTFDTKPNGDGIIRDANGKKLNGEQGEIIFTDPDLNKHNTDYTSAHTGRQKPGDLHSDDADGITGRIAFEDQVRHGDRDYNDLVVDVKLVESNRPPVAQDAEFAVAENSAAGTVVGKVLATDQDAGQSLTYTIIGGNEKGAFAINAATGEITVADASKLDFEDPALDGYSLTVQVTDNGSGALSDTATINIAVTNVVETLQGHAVDGYVSGATVFADADGDGTLDTGEKNTTTDASGNFTLVDGSGPLVMTGGVDLATGLAFTGMLRAPEGSTVVTPLTTLIAALVDQGQSVATASAHVASAFGLDGLTIDGQPLDLLNLDAIPDALAGGADGDAAAIVLGAGIQVRNTIVQIGALLAGAGATDAHAAATAALVALVSSGAEANLDDPATVQALINSAADIATGVTPSDIAAVVADAALVLAESNEAVNDALAGGSGMGVLQALAQVATVAQGTALSHDLAQAGATNDPGTLTDDYTGPILDAKIANAPVGDVDGGTTGTPGDDVLSGGPGSDLMDGLGGNDQLFGLAGNDQLFGGDGNDLLVGDLGNDFLRGGAGNDVLNGGIVADLQSNVGFRDTDRVDYSTATAGVNVNLATGIAFDGDGGTDTLIGIESVTGSPFDDVLTGTGTTFAEFFRGGAGNDTIQGAGLIDRAEYLDATSGVTIVAAGGGTSAFTASGNASVGTDSLTGVEQFTGSDYADTYIATGYASPSTPGGLTSTFNAFEGRGGNDAITGNGSTRIEFVSATGAVSVSLAAGTATGDSSVGTDTFTGVNQVRGSAFDDTMIGGNPATDAFEAFEGRGGDDAIDGGSGWDRADYAFTGPLTTGVTINLAAGTAIGDPALIGTDTLHGIEAIRGSYLADVFDATGFSSSSTNAGWFGTLNEIDGMAGDDLIIGNGNTRLSYGNAREAVTVNVATGTSMGGASEGNDSFSGVSEVFGSDFGDTLLGSAVNETLRGNGGNDLLAGGGGNDVLDGGFGNDRADYSGSFGAVNVDLSLGTASDGMGGTDTLTNIEDVTGTSLNDSLIGNSSNNVLKAGLGNDFLRGGGGNDLLDGGVVADLQSDAGARDSDRVDYGTALTGVNVNLATGVAFDGAGGTDTLVGIEGVAGSPFDDVFTGSSTFAENYLGGAGNDTIYGGGGFDLAQYFSASSSVTISVGGFGGSSSTASTVTGDASVGTDSLFDVEQFSGSNLADTFTVGSFVSASQPGGFVSDFNSFEGRGGNDIISGNGGTRIEYTGATGAVNVNFETGIAAGDGSVGTDSFTGVNAVRGSPFADTLLGGNPLTDGFESFDGRGGNDTINGGSGWDRADYAFNGPISSGIMVNLAAGTAQGDPVLVGTDTLLSVEAIRGSYLTDSYNATGFSEFSTNAGSNGTLNEFEGMAGNDTVTGNGNTRVSYSSAREGVSVDLQAGTAVGGASVGSDSFSGVNAVRGSNFDDVLTGSASNDTLEGLFGNDVLKGGAGNDVLNGGVLADLQSDIGLRDTDRVDYSSASSGVNVNLASGIAQDGDGGTDTLIGIESVTGSAYDDVLTGGSAAYVEFFRGGAGNDTIDGAGSLDRAEYLDATSGVTIVAAGGGSAAVTVIGDSSVGTDSVNSVEQFTGSDYADTFNATGFASPSTAGGFSSTFNSFEGRAGNDSIVGNGSTRLEFASATSAVNVNLATGVATGDASVGTDTFTGVILVRGSSFADTLTGGNPANNGLEAFEGRGGDDFIDGGQGFDRADYVFAGPEVIGINVNLAAGIVTGDPVFVGTDTLRSIEAIRGSYLGDVYDATGFSDSSTNSGSNGTFNLFEGMSGNDIVYGNGNTRVIYVGSRESVSVNLAAGTAIGGDSTGSDTLVSGVNGVSGSNFNDTLDASGTFTTYILDGGNGDDVLIGSFVSDTLLGGTGDDLLRGGQGTDFIDGGPGSDRIDFDSLADAGDTIANFAAIPGGDVLDIADLLQNWTSYGGGTGGPLSSFVKLETIGPDAQLQIDPDGFGPMFWQPLATLLGRAGLTLETLVANGNLDTGAVSGVTLIGTPGNDSLIGTPGNDTIIADLGNDFLRGGAGNDVLNGGVVADLQSDVGWRDTDRVDYSTATAGVNVNLATGIAYDGEGGVDTLIGIEQVNGSAFADIVVGTDTFAESFNGGAGNDTIYGDGGIDRAEYSSATSGVSIHLGAYSGPSDATATVSGDASVGTDTIVDVEQFNGSNFADTFVVGSFLSASNPGGFFTNLNTFLGWGGDDIVTGNGNTRLEYSSATAGVTVNLAMGIASGNSSVGTDSFTGVNSVRGSQFADMLTGGNTLTDGFESFEGRAGNDTIDGGSGWDRADYAFDGAVTIGITVDLAGGTVSGDPALTGTDTLMSVEAIRGSHLADSFNAIGFSGTSLNAGSSGVLNEFEGMAGNDAILGNGSTRISYAFAREGVSVDMQAGTAVGGASVGTDGFSGVNAVRGSNFDDVLSGSAGNDILEGGFGNDLLRGGAGVDFINGGPGSDRIDFDSLLDGSDTIANFEAAPGGDVLDIADLLQNWTSYSGGAGGPLADYFRLETVGIHAQLQIDTDGSVGAASWQPLATILGGSGLDVDTLLSQGNLDVLI